MFSDGYAHSLEWFSDTYKEIQVGREDFPAEKEKGLYWFTGDLRIPEGTEQIVFTYRNPEGALIQRENVFVVRDGEQGDPAPQYLGMFANPPAAREDNTPLQKGDTYLNKTDRKLYRYDGLDWIAVPDEDPGWWEALGDAVKEAAESGVQITAANAWVEKLVAGTVLAQRLFTQQLVLSENGQIKSANYQAGQSGFQIRADGTAEFNNSIFRGMLYAQGGRFENAEILNCSGSINFTIAAGDNYVLKEVPDMTKPLENNFDGNYYSTLICASGTLRLSFSYSCTNIARYITVSFGFYLDGKPVAEFKTSESKKLFFNGREVSLSGTISIDISVQRGQLFTAIVRPKHSERDEAYTRPTLTNIFLKVKDNPGILTVLGNDEFRDDY